MDEVCYEKVLEFVRAGHQVMVFVHARNATVNTAMVLKETAQQVRYTVSVLSNRHLFLKRVLFRLLILDYWC